MSQVTGAFSVELDMGKLADAIASRVVAALTAGGYVREPDPGQGAPDPERGRHDGHGIGLEGLGDG